MNLSEQDKSRIIEMAWEDRTPFEAIKIQFGVSEKEVIKLMRSELNAEALIFGENAYNLGASQKHLKSVHKICCVSDALDKETLVLTK